MLFFEIKAGTLYWMSNSDLCGCMVLNALNLKGGGL